MNKKNTYTRNVILVIMIIIAAVFRLIAFKYPNLSNFNPVGAIAIFGGAYFIDKWKGYTAVLLTLFTTDVVLNYLYTSKFSLVYDGIIGVYLSFAIMVFLGSLIKKVNVLNVLGASIGAVLIHWLVTDMPWFYTMLKLYPNTWAGYGSSLIAAIPFEYNLIFGNLVFGILLFGSFELAKSKYAFLQTKRQLAL